MYLFAGSFKFATTGSELEILFFVTVLFFISLLYTFCCGKPVAAFRVLFFKTFRHGPFTHSTVGILYLIWLLTGFFLTAILSFQDDIFEHHSLFQNRREVHFAYDVILGLLGIILTLSAANDFPHRKVKNFASGTLDEHATVTHGEMVEHSFYQGLNLIQIIYIHLLSYISTPQYKLLLCLLATSPWLVRSWFPVNSFSANYSPGNTDPKSTWWVKILYRIKKYQYVFYKHFLLHGLNISLVLHDSVLPSGVGMAEWPAFRMYWLLLNTAYVMEFFLQTLVKKGHLKQQNMLQMQKLLMLASSIAAAGQETPPSG